MHWISVVHCQLLQLDWAGIVRCIWLKAYMLIEYKAVLVQPLEFVAPEAVTVKDGEDETVKGTEFCLRA